MKVAPLFLTAKKDKNVTAIVIKKLNGRSYWYLCIDAKNKYTESNTTTFVETDTDISIQNFSGWGKTPREITSISFHESVYHNTSNHIKTFLKHIKKDSDVRFEVIAYNGCDAHFTVGFVSHKLYGNIDGYRYEIS